MLKRPVLLASTLFGVVLAIGCGSSAPSTSDIRDALDNPTGSVQDKSGVTAATQRQSSGGSTGSVGAANPFGGGALTVERRDHKSVVDPMVPLAPFFRHAQRRIGLAKSVRQLTIAQEELAGFNECFEQAFANAGSIDPNSSNFDASFEIDFDSCGDGTITGQMSMSVSGSADAAAGTFELDASYGYNKLCIKSEGIEVCQDGDMEMTAEGRVAVDASSGDEFTMDTIAGWNFVVTIVTAEQSHEFKNKGGLEMKIGATDTTANATFRMVIFVTLPDGEEVSYTFTLLVDDTSASIKITGRDGELECTVDADGNGMCTGDLDLAWTAAEWDAAYESHAGT